MGMAASQARYLALVARKSNCEYEGQQINQSRTALSNQSANLFNQMLGLSVPTPPSTSDYTKTQYSFSDGTGTTANKYTITEWYQLQNNPDYNYTVKYQTVKSTYTGARRQISNPQVQYLNTSGSYETGLNIKNAYNDMVIKKNAYETAKTQYAQLSENQDSVSGIANFALHGLYNNTYELNTSNELLVGYDEASTSGKDYVKNQLEELFKLGALNENDYKTNGNWDDDKLKNNLYVYTDTTATPPHKGIAFKEDVEKLNGASSTDQKTLVYCQESKITGNQTDLAGKKVAYDNAVTFYSGLTRPSFVGNSELTLIETLSDADKTAIEQIVKDMQEQGISTSLANVNLNSYSTDPECIYKFTLNGKEYYTTLTDLKNCHSHGSGNNLIDNQPNLDAFYTTTIDKTFEYTSKALIETDGSGRFTSIRFENDTIKYTLNMETITDEDAYNDAMNQYYYENAKYDKTVQDINAKTSLIQQEDQQLELRLKQLDTEQNALSTEIDAVSKVVKDNIEKSFKTFSG